jgi:ribosomal protein S18 acetylase RimI-like enzyme
LPDDVTIRRGDVADAKALSDFGRRVFADTFAKDNTPEDMDAFLGRWYNEEQQSAELAEPSIVTLLAEIGDVLVGFVQIQTGAAPACVTGPAPIQIARFYVDHSWHGRGVATAMMDAALMMIRILGGATIWLGVWEHNPRAIRFYEKHGFTDVGSQPFLLGRDLQIDRVMMRAL